MIKNIKHFYFSFTDRENFYTGRVFGEKTSDVKLHMEDGLITGIIHTPDETYHIEVTNNTSSHILLVLLLHKEKVNACTLAAK